MYLIRSLFVSSFLTVSVGTCAYAIWQLLQLGSLQSAWLGTAVAAGSPALFFVRIFVMPPARTAQRLWGILAGGIVGTLISVALGGGVASLLAAGVGIVGVVIYDYWFSRFADRVSAPLSLGSKLPAFKLYDAQGAALTASELTDKPTVWMFFRGNWCPFCMAQVREIAEQYREIAARGAQVLLISPQSEAQTQNLAKKFDVPIRFLIDKDNQTARVLDIFAEKGLPAGLQVLGYDSDVPLPTVFITDGQGAVRYADLTDNYRIRPEPAEFLKVLDSMQAAA